MKEKNIMLVRFTLVCVLVTSMAVAKAGEDPVVVYSRRIIVREKTYIPPKGYVPDSDTAVLIANAVLNPIYGKAKIDAEKPWHTGLKDGVWTVVGTFNGKGEGGEAMIQLDMKTGAIIFVGHTM
jgi:hypothetical protein